LALRGKKVGFEAVLKKVDEMVALLGREQEADDAKKSKCEAKLDQAEDERKDLKQKISDLESEKAEQQDSLDTSNANMKALKESLKDGDEAAQTATEERKKEHAEFKELISSDSAAKDLLSMAKQRLNKFYHPSHKEHSDDEAASLVQIGSHNQLRQTGAPPPPPPTFEGGGYRKSDANHGVLGMISAMVAELDKEMAEAKVEEKNSQEEYEQTMVDLKEKRREDSKSLVKTAETKGEQKAALLESDEDLAASNKALAMKAEYEHTVHTDCDWLLQNYKVRKEARAEERDSMTRAKAVLSGADFSFLEVSARSALRR
jgi:chromosome segregation ATPase